MTEFYEGYSIVELNKSATAAPKALRKRYFPTPAAGILKTNKVLVEYRDGVNNVAPCILKGSTRDERISVKSSEVEPVRFSRSRIIDTEDLSRRQKGEALSVIAGEGITEAQKAAVLMANDMRDLNEQIEMSMEDMAAKMFYNNGLTYDAIAEEGKPETKKIDLRYYDGDQNPQVYTPATEWNQAGANIVADIHNMIRIMTAHGSPCVDLLVSTDVYLAMLENDKIQKQLNTLNYHIGKIEPEPGLGAVLCGVLNIAGRAINLITYDQTYRAENGETKSILKPGTAILTAPNCGQTFNAAVTFVDQATNRFYTHTGITAPQLIADPRLNTLELIMTSRPLTVPRHSWAWIAANVISGGSQTIGTTYKVTYDANGGNNAPDAVNILAGTYIDAPARGKMTKAGHALKGWNTQQDGNGTFYEVGEKIQINKALTLYAQWVAV